MDKVNETVFCDIGRHAKGILDYYSENEEKLYASGTFNVKGKPYFILYDLKGNTLTIKVCLGVCALRGNKSEVKEKLKEINAFLQSGRFKIDRIGNVSFIYYCSVDENFNIALLDKCFVETYNAINEYILDIIKKAYNNKRRGIFDNYSLRSGRRPFVERIERDPFCIYVDFDENDNYNNEIERALEKEKKRMSRALKNFKKFQDPNEEGENEENDFDLESWIKNIDDTSIDESSSNIFSDDDCKDWPIENENIIETNSTNDNNTENVEKPKRKDGLYVKSFDEWLEEKKARSKTADTPDTPFNDLFPKELE